MKVRKINQVTKTREEFQERFFEPEYRKRLSYFLNPDFKNKTLVELNQNYVASDGIADELQRLLCDYMDSIVALIGYPGVGKTTDIRYAYQIMNNAIHFDDKTGTIILPSFFEATVQGKKIKETHKIYEDVRTDLSKRIGSVCDELEIVYPELKEYSCGEEGKEAFYQFFRLTNPKALVSLSKIDQGERDEKIRNAYLEDYFIYIVTKLKFYLSNPICGYNRILILLDNVEQMDSDYWGPVILQYMRFYSCMRNFPGTDIEKDICVKMLISVRPDTYKLLKEIDASSMGHITEELYKTHSIDLKKYFERKYDQLPEVVKSKDRYKWKEVFNILIHLSSKFDNKYSYMIQNLVYLDLRETLKIYYQILSNNTWIVKKTVTNENEENLEYVFNNITVIRALACGCDIVYYNTVDNIIPNIFYDTNDKGNVILSLYILAYFISQKSGFWNYGEVTVKESRILADFEDVFGADKEMCDKLRDIISYLNTKGILSTSMSDEVCIENRGDTQHFYLSSRGRMIWNMLSADSVLMELYREDYYQIYDENNLGDTFRSSYDLMKENQIIIFCEIYKILRDLLKEEKAKVYKAIENGAYSKYLGIFGAESIVEHLMVGVDKSVEYSGNISNEKIVQCSEELKAEIYGMKNI